MKQSGEITIYKETNGTSKIEAKLINENIWLNQNQLSNLFDRDSSAITKHINNILKKKNYQKKAMCKNVF